ncbi:hypothetical protein FJZ17_01955 [Candidatus Pacearchaeota archaeon]|nr:hypothetical protein [Candidatus Pacearchaeota archaeon]
MPKRYDSTPNTRISLNKLKESDLYTFFRIAGSLGLSFSLEEMSIDDIKRSIVAAGDLEIRTDGADFGKLIITTRELSPLRYIHVYITYGPQANLPKDSDKVFDAQIRDRFIPSSARRG